MSDDGYITCVHLEVYGREMGDAAADEATAELSFAPNPSWSSARDNATIARIRSLSGFTQATGTQTFQGARSIVLPGLRVPVRANEVLYLHVRGSGAGVTGGGCVTVFVNS